MTQATTGYGSDVFVGNGMSPQAFVRVAEVQAVTSPDLQRGVVNATHMRSEEQFNESIPGMKSFGEATFTYNVIPADEGQSLLHELWATGARRQWYFPYPDGSGRAIGVTGFVTRISTATEVEGVFQQTCTITLTGPGGLTSWTPS